MHVPAVVAPANNQWDAYTSRYDLEVSPDLIIGYGGLQFAAENAPIVENVDQVLHAPRITMIGDLIAQAAASKE